MILVVLDRDNTLVEDKSYLGKDENWKEQIRILDEVIEGLKILRKKAKIVVASNQSGIARGYYDEKRAIEVNKEIAKRLEEQGVVLDGWYFCPYIGEDYAKEKGLEKNEWVKETDLRKPGIGMIKIAINELNLENPEIFFIGDKYEDVLAGINAGGIGIYVYSEYTKDHKKKVEELAEKYPKRVYISKGFLDACERVN